MRVVLLGATGRTGRLTAAELRRRGYSTTAVVREAGRAVGLDLDTVVEGDARQVATLVQALEGSDAVVSALGPVKGESVTVMRDATSALLDAMRAADVARLVAVTASGWVVDGDDPLSRYVAKPLLGRLLRDANADFEATEALIRGSGRAWTIVRPPRLLDGTPRRRYTQRRDANVRWKYDLRRADLAIALVDALEDPSSVGHVISVAR